MTKKTFYRYSRPLLCAMLACFGPISGITAATEPARYTEAATEPAYYTEAAAKPAYYADVEAMATEESLLRLRIRCGENFIFPMEIPSIQNGDGGAWSLKDYRELRSCPLPLPVKTIGLLEKQLTRMTESYSGEWSVYVKNLTTGDTFIINDIPMRSASVMKLFIMGTVYEAMKQRALERTPDITDLLTDMICASSNSASNQLLSILGDGSYENGIAKVNDYIARQGYSSLTHEYNGFEDASAICDSKHFNQVTAADCGQLLERIYRRTFASRQICNEVENLMLNQNTRYKIPKGLPEGVSVGNKTGEMDTVENDAAIIYGDYSDYILCVLSGDWTSKDGAIANIQEISSTVYRFFNAPSYYQMLEPDSYELLARLILCKSDESAKGENVSTVTESPESQDAENEPTESAASEDTNTETFDSQTDYFSLPDSKTGETAVLNLAEVFPFLEESKVESTTEDDIGSATEADK